MTITDLLERMDQSIARGESSIKVNREENAELLRRFGSPCASIPAGYFVDKDIRIWPIEIE